MPLATLASLDTLKAQARAFIRARFQNRAIGDANFLGKQALQFAMAMLGLQKTVEAVDRDSPPNPKTSPLGLASWGYTFGVPSNAGGFGKNQATEAEGGAAPVTGSGGTVVPALAQLTAPDGTTLVQLDVGGTIPFTGAFSAVTAGTAGNLPAGTVLTWVSPVSGCDGTVTLSAPLDGALDLESDAAFLARTLARLQQPPKGGANIDYITWALEQTGVLKAYVYPLRQGTGTVDMVITSGGSGVGRVPSDAVLAAVVAFVAAVQPTNVETASVLKPVLPADQGLTVRARVQLSPRYSWDWDDTGGSWAVTSYSAGAPSLTLNAAADPSLLAAVDLGLKPRLQVVSASAGAPAVPEQPRVVAYDVTKTVLTLQAPMAVAPTAADLVFAGAYAAPVIAGDMLAYVDSIGPSRASPYADVVNVWDDVVSLFGLAAAAVESVDADGVTPLVLRVPAGDVTVAVGSGSPAAADFEPADDLYQAPQLAWAAHVYVTQ